MSNTINYNNFQTPTGSWNSSATQPYLYKKIASIATIDNGIIEFTNLPAGVTVASGEANNPYVFYEGEYSVYANEVNKSVTFNISKIFSFPANSGGEYIAFNTGSNEVTIDGQVFPQCSGAIEIVSPTAGSIVFKYISGSVRTKSLPFNYSQQGSLSNGLVNNLNTFSLIGYDSDYVRITGSERRFLPAYTKLSNTSIQVNPPFSSALNSLYVKFNKA